MFDKISLCLNAYYLYQRGCVLPGVSNLNYIFVSHPHLDYEDPQTQKFSRKPCQCNLELCHCPSHNK